MSKLETSRTTVARGPLAVAGSLPNCLNINGNETEMSAVTKIVTTAVSDRMSTNILSPKTNHTPLATTPPSTRAIPKVIMISLRKYRTYEISGVTANARINTD